LTLSSSAIRGDQLREPFGEDRPRAALGTTPEATDSEAEDQLPTGEREVSHGPVIDTLDAPGPPRTERAAGEACGCGKVQPDGLAVERHLLEAKTSQLRKERC
jgi:hypothetical protein